jgi:hypothetical protein
MPIGQRIEGSRVDRLDGMHAPKSIPPFPGR